MGFVTKGLQQRMQKALSFSHLSNMGASKARAQDDDKEEDDDNGGDPAERNREDTNSKRSETARAQDDSDSGEDVNASASAESGDDGDDDADPANDSGKGKAKSKRARAGGSEDEQAQDDDDDKEDDDEMEMRGRSPAAAARRREQARCAAIFASRAAGRNPVMAAHLAFKTRLPRNEAIAMLEATPVPSSTTERALRNPRVGPGGSQELSGRQAVASSWDRAFEKANPRARRA